MSSTETPNSDPQVTLDDIADFVRNEGYKARIVEIDNVRYIESGTSGYKIIITFPSPGSLHFHCGLSKDGDDVVIPWEDVNRFNQSYRFNKLYLDDSGDIVANGDFHIDIFSPEAPKRLEFIFRLFDTTIAEMNAIMARAYGAHGE